MWYKMKIKIIMFEVLICVKIYIVFVVENLNVMFEFDYVSLSCLLFVVNVELKVFNLIFEFWNFIFYV